jgi:hypothetical protein
VRSRGLSRGTTTKGGRRAALVDLGTCVALRGAPSTPPCCAVPVAEAPVAVVVLDVLQWAAVCPCPPGPQFLSGIRLLRRVAERRNGSGGP